MNINIFLRLRLIKHFFLLLFFLIGNNAYGQEIQSHNSIKILAKSYLYQQENNFSGQRVITIGNMDPRLRLPLCHQDLEAFNPPGSRSLGNTSVGIRCQGIKPWTIYLPVNIKAIASVLISNKYLARGTKLTAKDVDYAERDLSTLSRGYISTSNQAIGKILKQPLNNGTVILPGLLADPTLIHRGENVILLAEVKGLEIRMTGKALMDGVAGEIIQVKNLRSDRVVEGEVSSPGIVKVQM